MGIRPDDPRSPSDQIKDDLRLAIAVGDLGPGEQLPSNSDLRSRYQVANQTAQNAINALKAEGLVYSVPGRGVFVRSDLETDDLVATMAKSDGDSPIYAQVVEQLEKLGSAIAGINDRLDEIEGRQSQQAADPRAD